LIKRALTNLAGFSTPVPAHKSQPYAIKDMQQLFNIAMKRSLWYLLLLFVVLPRSIAPAQIIRKTEANGTPNVQEITSSGINDLIALSRSQYNANQGDSAITTLLEALEWSNIIQYKTGVDSCLTGMLFYLKKWGSNNGNIRHAQVVEKTIRVSGLKGRDRRLSILYNTLGAHFSTSRQYARALLTYENALKALPDEKTKESRETEAQTHINIGEIWASLGEHDEAMKNLSVAEQLAIETNNRHRMSSVMQAKGTLFLNEDNLDSALYYLRKALEEIDSHPEQHPAGCACRRAAASNLCVALLQRHQAVEALELAEQEIARYEEQKMEKMKKGFSLNKMSDQRAFLEFLKGYAFYELKDYKGCEQTLLPLLDIVEREQVEQVLNNIHLVLSRLYYDTGKYKKAYEHKKELYELMHNNKVHREKSKLLSLRHQLERMEEETKKQLIISGQQAQLKEKNFWIGTISLATILMATSIFSIFRSSRAKVRLHHASILHLKQEKEITQLQAKVEGQEQERSRIAHELHDGIVSQLLSIKLGLQALLIRNQPVDLFEVNDIKMQLEDAILDLRRSAHNLMPDLLLQQGFALSVAALCEKVKRNTNIDTDFQAYGFLPRLPQENELALYRMVQELVQNVLKHAAATQLLVQLSCRDNLLSVTVEDNGKGISPATTASLKSSGLNHIRKKVELMGGQIDIRSTPGRQTTVYLEFDCKQLMLEPKIKS
jgi:two-component system NarL family sensor kinase